MKAKAELCCPECGSERLYKDGLRYRANGKPVQRWLCRNCGYRFSESNVKVNVSSKLAKTLNSGSNLLNRSIGNRDFSFQERFNDLPFSKSEDVRSHKLTVIGKQLNTFPSYNSKRQVGDLDKELKNLIATEQKQTVAGDLQKAEAKGKIVEFMWQLKRDGYSNAAIEHYGKFLKSLLKKGADLMNPESVKDVIATQDGWGNNTKCLVVAAYNSFASFNEIHWKPPKYKPTRKLPFIPLEKEIDALVVYCGKKTATIVQLLKETGMRIGEALKLKWIDVDLERKIITLNNPEKHGNPRVFKISDKLVAMLNRLPKTNDRLFGKTSVAITVSNFYNQRKRAAAKLQNPRLLRITFHTLRHWKATMEYQKTRDILHVMKLLGHKNINNTLIYTHLISYETQDYHSATADNVEEARKLIESGFEYICTTNDIMLFRKRK